MGKIEKKLELDDGYLRAFLISTFNVFNGSKTGAAIPHLDKNAMYQLRIPLPPPLEQKRIVAILDEAFAGIATATANAEKNLANARELFRNYRKQILSTKSPGWKDTWVGDEVTLQRGHDITKDQQRPGNVPVVSSGGVKSFHDTAMAKGPGVIIGRKGTLGKTFFVKDDYWPHDTTLWVKDFKGNDPRFVYHFFSGLEVLHLDSGAANPALNRNLVHSIQTVWPPIDRQRQIADSLDELAMECQRLVLVYEQKLTSLVELKQAILQEAFSGELVAQSDNFLQDAAE